MPRGRKHPLLIAGGGVAASLAALAMATRRPEVSFLLVAEEETFGGERTLTWIDGDVPDASAALLAPLVAGQSWDGWYALFPELNRKLKAGVRSIRPEAIDAAVRAVVPADRILTGEKIVAVREDRVLLHGGETILADGAIDARGGANLSLLELGWRAWLSREYRFDAPHRLDRPVLVDATVANGGECRFVSCVPLDGERLLVELNRYSAVADPGSDAGAEIDAWLANRGWAAGTIETERSGVVPVALGGDLAGLWRIGGSRVARLGSRGGFFHPTTGSPLADAAETALLLTQLRDLGGGALHDAFYGLATQRWKQREFYRSFNRTLIGGEGCRVLEGLCRLDSETIARFRGERLGLFDRRKVLAAASA